MDLANPHTPAPARPARSASALPSPPPPPQLYTRLTVNTIEAIDTKEQTWTGDVQLETTLLLPLDRFLEEACWDELAAATPRAAPRAEEVVALLQRPGADADALRARREELGRKDGEPLAAFRAATARLPSFSFTDWDIFRGDVTEFWAFRIAEKLDIINSKKILAPQERDVWAKARLVPGEEGAAASARGWLVCASVKQRVHTTFAQSFVLKDFPFDRQKLVRNFFAARR
jgi:hypothetical protein